MTYAVVLVGDAGASSLIGWNGDADDPVLSTLTPRFAVETTCPRATRLNDLHGAPFSSRFDVCDTQYHTSTRLSTVISGRRLTPGRGFVIVYCMDTIVLSRNGLVAPSWVAYHYDVTLVEVHRAIRDGRLPAIRIRGHERDSWAIMKSQLPSVWPAKRAA